MNFLLFQYVLLYFVIGCENSTKLLFFTPEFRLFAVIQLPHAASYDVTIAEII